MTGFLASFDIEDWFHAENIRPSLGGAEWDALEGRVERNTHELLDLLGEADAQATFFVLGWVARRYPALVRRIVDEGHELASHTDLHRQLWSLSRSEVEGELVRSRDSLEQTGGVRVLGVRAPNFSISEGVLDAMAAAGYWYDSSFFSLRAHGRYGRLSEAVDADAAVVEVRPGLLELPMSRLRVGGAALPWAGGAYFRLIPYPVFRAGVAAAPPPPVVVHVLSASVGARRRGAAAPEPLDASPPAVVRRAPAGPSRPAPAAGDVRIPAHR